MNNNFSFINEDIGYKVMYDNYTINELLPLKPDIEPRLIYFLRTLYYHKKYNIMPCVPLYMQFHIKKIDWVEIVRFIKKYNITIFNKKIDFLTI